MPRAPRFAVIGAAGFVAPKHLRAIKEVGGELMVAVDTSDSVGVLDSFFPQVEFLDDMSSLREFLSCPGVPLVDYISVCTPNHLHLSHCLDGLDLGAHVICEKPLVTSPECLESLETAESRTGHRVFPILQLRLHQNAVDLKARIGADEVGVHHDVGLHYAVHRGPWYDKSWKGQVRYSGGICVNIGIHFFDLLIWLFGDVVEGRVHTREPRRATGTLELQKARVQWTMSMEERDLLPGLTANRHLRIDGEELVLAPSDLHTAAYREILAGTGLRISDARPSLEAAHAAQHMELTP